MGYKLAFVLAVACLFQVSLSKADDAITAFKKQAEEDIPIYRNALEKKTVVQNTLVELTDKVKQLLQAREAHQTDKVLENNIQVLAGDLVKLAIEYDQIEAVSLDTARKHLPLVKALEEYLKKGL